jgi:hypothetical protein
MYFETPKRLTFARHFLSFIVRERRGLARVCVLAAIAYTQFGLLTPAVKVMSDIVTFFGQSRITKETALYAKDAKQVAFDSAEPPNAKVAAVKALG